MLFTSFQHVLSINKEEKGIFLRELYSLSYDVVEVVGSQVIGHKVPTENIRNSEEKEMSLLVLVNVWQFGSF